MNLRKDLKKFWNFLWYGKSIYSYAAFFVFAIVVLNVAYPAFMLVLSSTLGINDIVAVVSGSMVHDSTTPIVHNAYLQSMGFSETEINSFPYNNGLNPGDLLLVWKKDASEIKNGNIIVFKKDNMLIIHRVIQVYQDAQNNYYYTTKGDHNPGSLLSEINITQDMIKGVAANRVPFLGVPKMLLTNFIMAVGNVL